VNQKRIKFIDLFCGAGGLSEGFRSASNESVSFESVYSVEIDRAAAATYQRNFGHRVFTKPIEKLKRENLPTADLVIGGPPCQGFSPLGRMSPAEAHSTMNKLWKYFFKVVSWVEPKVFVVENVPEFLKSAEFVSVRREAERLGYLVDYGVLNAADFGVPQLRRRGFLIGCVKNQPVIPEGSAASRSSVKDVLWELRDTPLRFEFDTGREFLDFPELKGAELHLGRRPTPKSLERYYAIPPGGNRFTLMKNRPDLTPACWRNKPTGSTDVMGRLEWDKPSLTIRTEFYKPEKGKYLHPEFHRPITHLEAARLQTFPKGFVFCGSKIQIARQIGNAVPPQLASAVAEEVARLILRRPTSRVPRHAEDQLELPKMLARVS
jgi:DNA (cytosine-5)-methyltransferase 1